jgi:hypothetical protein
MPKKANPTLHPKHCKKISTLKPHLLDAVHTVLKSHGINAVVHSISFRPSDSKQSALSGQCGAAPCCMVNGVWTCPG